MKIVFMGTSKFAAKSLQKIIDDGYDVPLVVTQPDKKGNRNKIIPSPVKTMAFENGIDIGQPMSIRKEEAFIEKLKKISPDMIVVAAFGQILPESVLNIPLFGCINVHGSLLPKLRGASPMQAAILAGMDETGVTIMRIEKGMDTGDMISKVTCDIRGKDIVEVSEILASKGAQLLSKTIPNIINGNAIYEKQDDSKATYAKMISKKDGMTDFSESAIMVDRKIRAYLEWPTCYSYIQGKQVKFYKSEVLNVNPDGRFGTVSDINKNSYSINCGEGKILITEQQLQGKKRMSAGDFLRGYKLSVGDRFELKED
ncbi:MAG: methionyl-tRNA formyltransferase [Clostridiales bacterium]|nr:methionyl-tRNA formyltransferase [Clostridiales bacterium]